MKRLVLVGPLPPPYYGQSVSFRMLTDEVRRLGIPGSIVDLAHSERSQANIGQVTGHRVLDYLSILVRYAVAVAFGRKTVYITIAQSRQGFFRDCVMIWLAALFAHRIVVHLKGGNYHNFYAAQPRWLRALVRATLRRADLVLVLGERLRAMFDFDPRLAPRIRVVPNGLPDEREPGCAGKALPETEPVRILYLSNLVESKGYLDVLEAMRLLRERVGSRFRCDFYGLFLANPADDVRVTGAEHARALFETFVRKHGLEDVVRYHGVVSGEEKRAVLQESHFLVLPTRYNNEGQPVSIIEAMAHGNVVVSTHYRAIPDMVEDGVTGRLVPYGDPEAIALAIERLVRDPGAFAAMSLAAVTRFRERFTRRAHLACLVGHLVGEADASAPAGDRPEARWYGRPRFPTPGRREAGTPRSIAE